MILDWVRSKGRACSGIGFQTVVGGEAWSPFQYHHLK